MATDTTLPRPTSRARRPQTDEPERPLRFAVYLRISRDPDGTSTAPDRQLADCRKFAELRGWEIAEVFPDRDVSAWADGVERPQYETMLSRLHEFDGVLVWR